jgi:nitroreductase
MRITAAAIENAAAVIAVYNTGKVAMSATRLGMKFITQAHKAELQAIGASIQNMHLMANSLGIKSVWTDSPCVCQESINAFLQARDELVAMLALGYSDFSCVRSKRVNRESAVNFR